MRVQVQQRHLQVGRLIGRWLRKRIGRGRPAAEVGGVVLVPVDALGHRDERNVVNPAGLFDLDRRPRPVFEAYREVMREFGTQLVIVAR